jgi:iron complex transport system substrate-binding protein
MRRRSVRLAPFLTACFLASFACFATAADGVAVRDDAGSMLHLAAPARRIVSLAPHITELLYAAGAGAHLIATVEYSDYPPAAKALPRIGSYARLDLERIAALKPDLVIGWKSGNPASDLEHLRALGLPLFLSEPERIVDVARSLEQFGELSGTGDEARRATAAFRSRLEELSARYSARPPVRVFYEIWDQPLMTINGRQIISDVLRLCGGNNVFADLDALAPTVGIEDVLAADPEAIIASGADARRPPWLDAWKRWPRLTAAARGNLFFVDPDLVQRQTPRLLDGAAEICADLETARGRRPAAVK